MKLKKRHIIIILKKLIQMADSKNSKMLKTTVYEFKKFPLYNKGHA